MNPDTLHAIFAAVSDPQNVGGASAAIALTVISVARRIISRVIKLIAAAVVVCGIALFLMPHTPGRSTEIETPHTAPNSPNSTGEQHD